MSLPIEKFIVKLFVDKLTVNLPTYL